MSEFGTVSSATLARYDRKDASFLLLATANEELASDLLTTLSPEQLVALATNLPVDVTAVNTCFPRPIHYSVETRLNMALASTRTNIGTIAVYCAAASYGAINKLLLEIEELRKQERVISARIKGLLQLAGLTPGKLQQALLTSCK